MDEVELINRARDDAQLLWQAFEEGDADDLVKEIVQDEVRSAMLITQLMAMVHQLHEHGDKTGREFIMHLLSQVEE